VSLWCTRLEIYGISRDGEGDESNDVICMRTSSLHLHIATPLLVSQERSPGSLGVDFLPWFQSPLCLMCVQLLGFLDKSRL
jgi:hypothetical protein